MSNGARRGRVWAPSPSLCKTDIETGWENEITTHHARSHVLVVSICPRNSEDSQEMYELCICERMNQVYVAFYDYEREAQRMRQRE